MGYVTKALKTQAQMTTATYQDLEQYAKSRGAIAGLHGVEDHFADSIEALLHGLFIAQHGDLGTDPEILWKHCAERQEELRTIAAQLRDHQHNRFAAMEHTHTPPPFNLHLGLKVALGCVLGGLGASVMGIPMGWQSWAMLGVLAVLLTLGVQSLPRWARNVRYYLTLRKLQRRVQRLERTVQQLKTAAWKETELRSLRQEFMAPRRQWLLSIFEYYKAAGACMAQHQAKPHLIAA